MYIQAFYSQYTTKSLTRLVIQVAPKNSIDDIGTFKSGYDYYPSSAVVIDINDNKWTAPSSSGINTMDFYYASSNSIIGENLTYELSYAKEYWIAEPKNGQYITTITSSEIQNYPQVWYQKDNDGIYYRYEITNNITAGKYDVFLYKKSYTGNIDYDSETMTCLYYPYPYPTVSNPIFNFLYSNTEKKWKSSEPINSLIINLNEFIIKVQQWGNWWGGNYDTSVPSLSKGNNERKMSAEGVNAMYKYFQSPNPNYPDRTVDGNILSGEFTKNEPVSVELFTGLAEEFTRVLAKDKIYPIS